ADSADDGYTTQKACVSAIDRIKADIARADVVEEHGDAEALLRRRPRLRFLIREVTGGHRWHLVARNGRIVAGSTLLSESAAAARAQIDRMKAGAPSAAVTISAAAPTGHFTYGGTLPPQW